MNGFNGLFLAKATSLTSFFSICGLLIERFAALIAGSLRTPPKSLQKRLQKTSCANLKSLLA